MSFSTKNCTQCNANLGYNGLVRKGDMVARIRICSQCKHVYWPVVSHDLVEQGIVRLASSHLAEVRRSSFLTRTRALFLLNGLSELISNIVRRELWELDHGEIELYPFVKIDGKVYRLDKNQMYRLTKEMKERKQ